MEIGINLEMQLRVLISWPRDSESIVDYLGDNNFANFDLKEESYKPKILKAGKGKGYDSFLEAPENTALLITLFQPNETHLQFTPLEL